MKRLQLAISAITLAAAMSASAGSLTLTGSQLQGLTYTTNGATSSAPATAGYVAPNAVLTETAGNSFSSPAIVSVTNGYLGCSLGTLNALLASGTWGFMSFHILSENINGNTAGTANNGGVNDSAYWVITLNNPGGGTVTYNCASDTGLGANSFNKGNSTTCYTSGTGPNNSTTWSSVATTQGTWTVASVGVAIGNWNQFAGSFNTITIDSITVPSITIVNPSFEAPAVTSSPYYDFGSDSANPTTAITGWTIISTGNGVHNGGQAGVQYPAGLSIMTPADGIQEAYINADWDNQVNPGPTAVSQQLTATLQTNTTYTLGIYISSRTGLNPGTNYSVSLYAGGTLNSGSSATNALNGGTLLTGVTPVIPPTSFWTNLTATFAYNSSFSSQVGQPLDIVISAADIGGQTYQLDFDLVTITSGVTTTTTVTSSQNPSLFGGGVTFTATVAAVGSTPTGTVTFYNGTNSLGTGALNASGVAYYGASSLAFGTNNITAVYAGDGICAPSTSSVLTQTNTGPISSTISNNGFESPSLGSGGAFNSGTPSGWTGSTGGVGEYVPTSTQYPGGLLAGEGTQTAYIGGTGSFYQTVGLNLVANASYFLSVVVGQRNDSGFTIGTPYAQLIAGSTVQTPVSASTNTPSVGTLTNWALKFTAPSSGGQVGQALEVLLGETGGTQANFDNVVLYGGFATTNILTSSQNPSMTGGAVTFTATVTGAGGTPTGTVVFMLGTNTLASGTLNASGVASFSTTNFATAISTLAYAITAVYGGDTTFNGSTSGTLLQTVTAPTAIPVPNGGFENDVLTAGNRAIPANSWGNTSGPGTKGAWHPTSANFTMTSSNTLAAPAGGTNVGFLSGPNGSAFYQFLSPNVVGGATYMLSGAVGVSLGNQEGLLDVEAVLGTGGAGYVIDYHIESLVNSTPQGSFAAWNTTHVFGVSGDASVGTSMYIQFVAAQNATTEVDFDSVALTCGYPTTTSIASSANPASSGASVTLTATVNGPSGISAPTNGTVTFMAGTITLGTATVNSSHQAALSTTAIPTGTNVVTAIYGGNGNGGNGTSSANVNYGGSMSSTLSEVVTGSTPANAYKITATTTTPVAGASDTITITQVDSTGATETGYSGTTNLTFSGLSAAPNSSLATVNGTSLGTATSITFTNGVSTAALVAYDAQTATLNVTDGTHSSTSTGGTNVTLTVSAGAVTAAQSTVSASPTSVTANGSTTSTITVTLNDANSNPVSGKTVTLAKSSGPGSPTISAASGTSSSSGVVTFTVKSTTAGTDVFAATDTTDSNLAITQTASVIFTAGAVTAAQSTVSASPTSVTADGSTTSTITVTLNDANSNPVSGKTVTLAKSSGPGSPTISAASGTSSSSGVVTFTVKSTTAGTDVFAATDTTDSNLAITQTASVIFTAGAVTAAQSTVSASPTSVTADGSTTSTITVTLSDANNNPVSGKTVTLAKSSGPGSPTISAASGTSSSSGVVTFTVKSTTAGTDVFAATDATDSNLAITQTASVIFTAGAVTAAQSTVSASPTSVTADGSTTSTITVTLNDANNNPVSGKTVTLAKSSGPGSPTISAASGSSSSSGVVTFTVTSTTAGTNVFTATDATDSNLAITQTASVTFTVGAVTAAQSTVTASPTSVTADGSTTSTITVTLNDANNNPVSGKTVTLSKSSGPGSPTISAASGTSSSFGVVTFTVKSTTAGTNVFTATDTTDSSLQITQTASVTFAPGAVTKLVFTTSAVTLTAGVASGTITVQRQDVNGNPNTTEANRTVVLSSTSGGTVTFTPASPLTITNGFSTISFTYTDTQAGTPTVTAASSAPTGITSVTQLETVNAAAASQLVFTNSPITVTAGVASGTITVQRQDAFNNPNTNDATISVALASSSTGTVTFNPTFLSITNGSSSAGFTYTDTQAGTPTITASKINLTSGTQQETITPAALDHFVVTTPGTQTAGSSFSITTITAQDTYNNTVTNYTGTVDFSETGGGAGGSVSPSQSSGFNTGVLSGQNVTVTKAGSGVTLTATDHGGTKTGTSGSFAVNPGLVAAAQSTVAASPTSVPADGSTTSTITVTLKDASSNPVSGKTVTLGKTSGGGSPTITTTQGTTDSSGVATFTVKSSTSAADVFTATDTTDGVIVTQTATVNFTAGAATQTRVETAADGSGTVVGVGNVTSGSSITVYAITRDDNGNFVGNPSATWSLQSITGGVVSGDLVASGASATFTGHLLGSGIIQAVASTFTGQSGVQTVVAGAVTQTRVETAANGSGSVVGAQNVASGSSLTVYAVTRDANTNFVANPSASWSLINGSNGVVSSDLVAGGASAVFTGHIVGAGQIQAVASGFTGDSGILTVIPGAINPTNTTISASPTSVSTDGGATTTITVTAKDNYTNVIPGIAANNVVVAATGSGNTLTQPTTATGTNGQTTATLASTKAEVKTLSVIISGTTISNTTTVTFTPGALDHFVVGAISTQTAGVAFNIGVTAQDVNNNTVTNYSNTVDLTTTAGTIAPTTSGSFTAGVLASQSVTVSLVGTGRTITVIDHGGTKSGTSAGFTVISGALDHFVIGAISSPQVAGSPFNVSITAQDVNNNTATSFTGTVNLTSTAGTVSPTNSGSFSAGVLASQSVTLTNAGTGKTLTATDHAGTGKTGTSGTFTVNPGSLSAGNSTISPATASIPADGTSTQVLTVQTRDLYNNNLTSGGATVVFSKVGGGSLSSTTDNGNGTYTATLTAASSTGIATNSATIGGTTVGISVGASSSIVTFTAQPASAAYSTISPATASKTADGSSTQVITVQARDSHSNNVTLGGATVVISKQSGTGTLGSTTDNGNGTYTATLTSPTALGSATLIATLNGTAVGTLAAASNSVITFVPGPASASASLVSASPTNVVANGSSSSTITITVRDANSNVISGATVTLAIFRPNGGNFSLSTPATTGTNGQTTATLTSTVADTKTITASVGATTITQQAFITFTPQAPSAGASTVSVSPSSNVTADNSTTATITVTLKDPNNNVVSGQTVTLSSSGSGNTISTPATTDTNGQTTATIKSTKAETKTITAVTGVTTITQKPTVVFVPGAASAYRISAVTTNPLPATADQLTILLVDQYTNTVTNFTGNTNLTFSGLNNAFIGTVPTVTDKNAAAVNLGSVTTVTFANGQSSVGGSLKAYRAETNTLAVHDNATVPLSSSSAGGTGVTLAVQNANPIANGVTYTRASGLSLKISISSVLTNDSDPNGDIVSFSGLTSSQSADGATISTNSSFIFYLPNSATTGDTFNYVVTDGHGGFGTNIITVNVVTPGGLAKSLTLTGGQPTINFAGIPSFQYDVQRSTNGMASWSVLTTITAPSAGLFSYIDTNAPQSGSAFYRLMQH